jgi:hypothetical protein
MFLNGHWLIEKLHTKSQKGHFGSENNFKGRGVMGEWSLVYDYLLRFEKLILNQIYLPTYGKSIGLSQNLASLDRFT